MRVKRMGRGGFVAVAMLSLLWGGAALAEEPEAKEGVATEARKVAHIVMTPSQAKALAVPETSLNSGGYAFSCGEEGGELVCRGLKSAKPLGEDFLQELDGPVLQSVLKEGATVVLRFDPSSGAVSEFSIKSDAGREVTTEIKAEAKAPE